MKKSRIIVKVKGLNQERAINNISQIMKIYNLKRDSHNICTLEVDYHQKKEIFSLISQHNLEIIEVSSLGFKHKIKNILTSYGVLAGVLLSCVLYFFQYNFIWQIKVIGTENLIKKEIVCFVEDNLNSKQKNKIKTEKIEQALMEKYKEISSVSVAVVGQSLIVNINEAILPEEMQGDNKSIVSQFDGLITDIKLVQGTLAVDVGDIVKKGDVLVYPYIIDSQGEKRDALPKAEIWADVWIKEKETHYDYSLVTRRTGREESVSKVFLYDLLIYQSVNKFEYLSYEIEEATSYLNKNNILPFVLVKTTYYETETIEISQEFSSVKEEIIQKARQKTLIFLQENEIIKEEKVNIKEGAGWHEVSYLVTVNRNIGEIYEN